MLCQKLQLSANVHRVDYANAIAMTPPLDFDMGISLATLQIELVAAKAWCFRSLTTAPISRHWTGISCTLAARQDGALVCAWHVQRLLFSVFIAFSSLLLLRIAVKFHTCTVRRQDTTVPCRPTGGQTPESLQCLLAST